jgi:hypothetical protein
MIMKKAKKIKQRDLTKPSVNIDLARHALLVARRKAVKAEIQLITAKLQVAEATLRYAETRSRIW